MPNVRKKHVLAIHLATGNWILWSQAEGKQGLRSRTGLSMEIAFGVAAFHYPVKAF
ncbi:hypothetical protein [Paenibacillus sp. 11B]|uniref:hypothetical protein n=1 Tax=Paenibacillus sp. 11B TaxID=3060965 RepID=UPI00265B629A|nr:hypothetical protein [Paenibacillus sp. 11B]